MDKYIWIFPVLFIFHDMEEIIWLPEFMNKNREDIIKRYPIAEKPLSAYRSGMTSEAFAVAVYEELILLIAVCALAELTGAQWAMGIWYGGLIAFTVHLIIHILQSLAIKKYIPSLLTSILVFLPSVMLLIRTRQDMNTAALIGIITGIAGVAANLKLAHVLMNRYEKRRQK